MTPLERLEKAIKEIDNMEQGKWINLSAPEIQALICEDTYHNEYLYVDELDPYAVSFPVAVESGVLEL